MEKKAIESEIADLQARFNNTPNPTALEVELSKLSKELAQETVDLEEKLQALQDERNKLIRG